MTLKFPNVALIQTLVAHAKAAPEHRASYSQPPEPGLFLVKDDGIYLMSSGIPMLMNPVSDKRISLVAYARGFDPRINPNWWDAARNAVGGDDFSELLPVSLFDEAFATKPVSLDVKVTSHAVTLSWLVQNRVGA